MTYRCKNCGGKNVQIELPAYCDPNDNFKAVSVDVEAEALVTWCVDCDKTDAGGEQTVIHDDIEETGRWQHDTT